MCEPEKGKRNASFSPGSATKILFLKTAVKMPSRTLTCTCSLWHVFSANASLLESLKENVKWGMATRHQREHEKLSAQTKT